ncbi:MAG: DEAD/DEAH box helicase [Lachnospiraceae bacterium]
MQENSKKGFEEFPLSKEMMETLSLLKYEMPTKIQREAIPYILDGKDLVGQAQTGSGKTAAFGIPLCENVIWDMHHPQVLVLEPTRELALQVKEELHCIGRKKRLKVPVVFGGMPIQKEIMTIKQKSHILVGTPGRVMDHIRRGSFDVSHIKYVVIDEADHMLNMGFLEEVEGIINIIKENHPQYLLFSATFDSNINHLIEKYLKKPIYITIEEEQKTVEQIKQFVYYVEHEEKLQVLLDLLVTENPKECIIFCGTREMVDRLFQMLKRKGIKSGALHGGMEQRQRLDTVEAFREGRFLTLVTTDVAARGIDFPGITHVFNYDFPTNMEHYVHRVGRTGRNKKSGIAISFVAKSEQDLFEKTREYTNATIEKRMIPTKEEVKEKRGAYDKRQNQKRKKPVTKKDAFQDSIMTLMISGGKKSKMRAGDIVGAICSVDGLEADDIGSIDIRESMTYVEILNGKGKSVKTVLEKKTIKGKIRKIK